MLEGKTVNLRVIEKEDLPLIAEWFSSPEVGGEYIPLHQMPRTEAEKMFEGPHERKSFIMRKRTEAK